MLIGLCALLAELACAGEPVLPESCSKILFVKRLTFDVNHYYTEYINSTWQPDGNICLLDVKTGEVSELAPELKRGVFGRYDLDFDARHIVFSLKKGPQDGHSLYEMEIDPDTDKRILYTRWEYVDKGAVSVKCLWAMRPDGSGSSEIHGNDLALPPTLLFSRPISPTEYVTLGTPTHHPCGNRSTNG